MRRKNQDYVIQPAAAQTVGASITNQAVTRDPFTLHGDGRSILIAIRVSAVTVVTGVTISLFTGVIMDTTTGVVTYRATADKTVSVTTSGVVEIRMNVEDATDITKMPLGVLAKVTATTGVGDSVTVAEVRVIEVDRPT